MEKQNSNTILLYGIHDRPPLNRWILASIQQLCSILIATILIPAICGVPIAPALVGAGLGTLVYQLFTRGRVPMFISSAGGFVAAITGALALGTQPNFTAVFVGTIIVAIVYCIAGLLVKMVGTGWLNKLLPPIVVGPVVTLIGLNLATFIPTYFQVGGEYNLAGIGIGFLALLITALIAHYSKGFMKNMPFLLGILITYGIALILTLTGIAPIIDLSVFQNVKLFEVPDFAFFHISFSNFDWHLMPQILLLFVPLCLVCISEHIADHKALSAIVGEDLTQYLGDTLIGDGIASAVGGATCSLANTSYGESIATTGFSKIAYTGVLTLTALFCIALGFLGPVQAFFTSIPSCIFGGCAAILYGFIALSGIKVLVNSNIDYEDNKNIIVIASILTLGVSGLVVDFGVISFSTTALALIVGIILNLILRNKKETRP